MQLLGKKTVIIAIGIGIVVLITAITDISNAYSERRELRNKLAIAVQDNETMRATVAGMSEKLREREDENQRITKQSEIQRVKLESALQQSRVWSSERVPDSIADGLRAATNNAR